MALERRSIGRYVLYDRIASGARAHVHLGRLVGAVGFARTVAIKRMLPHCATDAEMVPRFVEEARLAARIRHPNVVATVDVVLERDELLIVMEYVAGESLSRLLGRARARQQSVPPAIASAIAIGVLEGLHAAHEALSERGEPLGIIHRDVSPQNVMVGADGVARVVDFGNPTAPTRESQVELKAGYIAPEQITGEALDRRVDVYAAGVVLWEALAGRRLFDGAGAPAVMAKIIVGEVAPPSTHANKIPPALDAIVMRALSRSRVERFDTASDMAAALERAMPPASPRDVEAWVLELAGDLIDARAALVAAIESDSVGHIAGAEARVSGRMRANAVPSVLREGAVAEAEAEAEAETEAEAEANMQAMETVTVLRPTGPPAAMSPALPVVEVAAPAKSGRGRGGWILAAGLVMIVVAVGGVVVMRARAGAGAGASAGEGGGVRVVVGQFVEAGTGVRGVASTGKRAPPPNKGRKGGAK